jgi:hypothetical protein
MQPLKYKRLMLILCSPPLIFALGVMTSVAQEKVILKDKVYIFGTKMQVMNVADTEVHIIAISESKGVHVGSGALANVWGFLDLVKGNGTLVDHALDSYPDGSKIFLDGQGKITTTLSPEVKPITTGEGTMSMVKGTGKWEGFQGSGIWKSKAIAEGIGVMEWEGEFIKK